MMFGWDEVQTRPRFTPEEKKYIYDKFKGICQGCGKKKDIEDTDIDHIKPFSLYPTLGWRESNLQILCRNCNTTKGDGTMAYLRRRLKERGVAVKGERKAVAKPKPKVAARAKPKPAARSVAKPKPAAKAVAKPKPKVTARAKPKPA